MTNAEYDTQLAIMRLRLRLAEQSAETANHLRREAGDDGGVPWGTYALTVVVIVVLVVLLGRP